MGKYDRIFKSEQVSEIELSDAEGLAAIVVIAALADNPSEPIDPYFFLDTLSYFELFDRYSDEELLELVSRLMEISEEGLDILFDAANEAIDDDLVPGVYMGAVLARINPDTGKVSSDRAQFLKELQEVFDVEDDEAVELTALVQKLLAESEEN